MILKGLVALTGVEPGFAGFFCFLQVPETTKAGFDRFAGISARLYKTCTRETWPTGRASSVWRGKIRAMENEC